MIAKEGFFSSLTLLSILFFFVFIDIIYVNPFIILTVIILVLIFNPAIWIFLWTLYESLGTFIMTIIGGIVGGPIGAVTGLGIGLTTGILVAIAFLVMLFVKILPFVFGLIYALWLVPKAFIECSWGIGIYFVQILLAFFLLYYLLYGNDFALYGFVATLIIAGLHTFSIYFVVGLAMACLAGTIFGLKLSLDIRNILMKAGLVYYMGLVGISMVGPNAEILQAMVDALRYLPILAPANLILMLFIMNVIAGKIEWNSLLIKLIAIAYIFYCFGSAVFPSFHLPFTSFFFGANIVLDPSKYNDAIYRYLPWGIRDIYRAYAETLGGAVATLVWAIYNPPASFAVPYIRYNFLDLYFLFVAFTVLFLAFLFDMVTGLTAYSVFPMVKQVFRLPKKLEKAEKEKAKIKKKGEKTAEELKGIYKVYSMGQSAQSIQSAVKKWASSLKRLSSLSKTIKLRQRSEAFYKKFSEEMRRLRRRK